MTLFLKVTRDYIKKQVSHTNSNSSEKDDSYEGYGRGEPLSAAKQATFQTLSDELDSISWDERSDKRTKERIEEMIECCRKGISEDFTDNDAGSEGQSNKLLDKIDRGLRAFYTNCRELELLNQPYDPKNPAQIVQQVLLTYLTKRDKFKDALRELKKQACKNTIIGLRQNIRDLSPVEAMPIVRRELDFLEREKSRLCQEHAKTIKFSGFTFALPAIVASKLRRSVALETAIKTATKQLNLLRLDPPVEIPNERTGKKASRSSTASTLSRLGTTLQDQFLPAEDDESDDENSVISSLSSASPKTQQTRKAVHSKAASVPKEQVMTQADLNLLSFTEQKRARGDEDDESSNQRSGMLTRSQSSKKTEQEPSNNPFDFA